MTIKSYMRSLRFEAVEVASDGLTIEGYCAVFDDPIEVWDWDGHYMEQFDRHSFDATLVERGPAKVKMQFNHGHDSAVGSLPIGSWEEIRPDGHGLYVKGRLLDVWHAAPVRAAIEIGAVDGMSIRFQSKVATRDETGDLPMVTHQEVKLLEAGPVTWPAYEATEVGVRSGDAVLELFRAMVRGEVVDLAAVRHSPDTVVEPDPKSIEEMAEPVQHSLVSLAERRLRALELRGMTTNDPTGAAAPAAC